MTKDEENTLLRAVLQLVAKAGADNTGERPDAALVRQALGYKKPGRKSKPQAKVDWTSVSKKCPHCGEKKFVDPSFGTRKTRGREYAQPWCTRCRATTNYHSRPRKNRTVNNPE